MKLEINNVSCGYNGKPILENVSATVDSGEICCILGENGVGKSTLFKTVLNLIRPIYGNVYVDGQRINDYSRKKLSTIMAYVSQSHVPPFNYSVKEVITMGRTASYGLISGPSLDDKEIVENVADIMGISHLMNSPYMDISGGERQMVMICRALAQQAGILVLDEPTANLDYGNQVKLLNVLGELSQHGFTIVFTSHNPEQALLLNAKTLILSKTYNPIFGGASEVVTSKNLHSAYGADIRVVNVVDDEGTPVKICIPRLEYKL